MEKALAAHRFSHNVWLTSPHYCHSHCDCTSESTCRGMRFQEVHYKRREKHGCQTTMGPQSHRHDKDDVDVPQEKHHCCAVYAFSLFLVNNINNEANETDTTVSINDCFHFE